MAIISTEAAVTHPIAGSAATESRPLRFEEEVVAMFEQHRNSLLRYLLSFRIAAPDAEEIVQEVFLSLFQHLQRGKSRANLHGWVFKVAHNLALRNRIRAQRQSPGVPEAQTDSAPGPEERAADLQRQDRLLAVVKALPEVDRWCLSLRAEGLKYREIARVLGISLGAVSNSLERSLSRLARADERGSCHAAECHPRIKNSAETVSTFSF
jgi:RNA polymerase sigma-70 factor (ECF subfamily)